MGGEVVVAGACRGTGRGRGSMLPGSAATPLPLPGALRYIAAEAEEAATASGGEPDAASREEEGSGSSWAPRAGA